MATFGTQAANRLPKSTLGRLTLLLAVIAAPMYVIKTFSASVGSSGWFTSIFDFIVWLLGVALIILGFRWMRSRLMWRLRNRLVVTYIFIGVIPVILLLMMGAIAGYLFAGQFSTFVVTNDLSAELRRLEAANAMMAADIAAHNEMPAAAVNELQAAEARFSGEFPGWKSTAWIGKSPVILQKGDAPGFMLEVPEHARKSNPFGALILDDDNRMYLRAANTVQTGKEPVTVVTSVPLTPELLERVVQNLGSVTAQPPDVVTQQAPQQPRPATTTENKPEAQKPGGVKFKFGTKDDSSVVTYSGNEKVRVSAGKIADKQNRLDAELTFGTALNLKHWRTGEARMGLLIVQTRPSTLYNRLFKTLGEFSNVILSVLIGIAILFALIEAVALLIGIRLTRTMTASVAHLYDATQHIETGALSHRIQVTRNDQLAALERSFNSMTESLQKLIAEQKEKQRIESELAIAQEVQALLFPRDISSLEAFEVHGICRPARTVSGDYYDFLPMGAHQLGLAVGDISGKGISAALLMATVHAFVRAYTLVESVPALAAVGSAEGVRDNALVRMTSSTLGDIPPGTLLAMLNHQLYRSTPSEKYATMFLGFYDARTRELKYSNAGHLPPIVIGNDGSIKQLETGGLVVGLFGDVTYADDAVEMQPGDIFVAYSDGITEPENEFGEFGEERLIQLVQENRHLPLERISDIVVAAVTDWIGGNEQPDDITLVLGRAL